MEENQKHSDIMKALGRLERGQTALAFMVGLFWLAWSIKTLFNVLPQLM